mgnify:CR=1 FL=1
MEKIKWGCSTASAQIEGAYNEDGKGLSIWDHFVSIKGMIEDGSDNKIAADSYHKYKEDIKLVKELGCDVYRFSISWPRIIPDGKSEVNLKGLEYYSNLIDECLKNGIEPFVTLYHWDMPLEIFKEGGLNCPNLKKYFAHYCEVVVSAFKDRVKNWIIINEPTCIMGGMGGVIPKKVYSLKEMLQFAHTINVLNAIGVEIVHKYGGNAGSSFCGNIYAPSNRDNALEYEEAKRRTLMYKHDEVNLFSIFTDPEMTGKYGNDFFSEYKDILPKMTKKDLELINKNTCDFIALNVYFATTLSYKNGNFIENENISSYRTTMGWFVNEECLYWAAKVFSEKYKKPLYISENGIAVDDKDDNIRSKYIENHIKWLIKAHDEGVDVRGYETLDNSTYGSVIYDLKGEDLARKQEIGTAKYSDRDVDIQKANEALKEENKKLAEDNANLKELVKLQGKETHGKMLKQSSIETVAGRIMKSADATGNKAELAKLLAPVYQYIVNDEDVTMDGIRAEAKPAIDWIQNNIKKESAIPQEAQDILNYVKGYRVYVSPELRNEIAYAYGNYNDYRKSLMGRVILTSNPADASFDEFWYDLSNMYPETFDETISDKDQPQAFKDAIDNIKRKYLKRWRDNARNCWYWTYTLGHTW